MKFDGLPALMAQIRTDIGAALHTPCAVLHHTECPYVTRYLCLITLTQLPFGAGIARSQLALPRPQRWRQARFKDDTAPLKATRQQGAKQPAVRQQEAVVSPKQPADRQQEAAVGRAQPAVMQQEAAVSQAQPAVMQQEAAMNGAQPAVMQQEAAVSRVRQTLLAAAHQQERQQHVGMVHRAPNPKPKP
jgi:hypothetical protein